MPVKADRIVATNVTALKTKYGAPFSKVNKAVTALIAAVRRLNLLWAKAVRSTC
jgi:hypothetical protein